MIRRRNFLRGMAGGGAVAVGLPLLEIHLNGNGTALASGAPRPVRFGTWTWGCGMQSSRWVPQTVGAGYELTPELMALGDLRRKVNLFSDFSVLTDGRQNKPHTTGAAAVRTGVVPVGNAVFEAPTLDVIIADAIGGGTRFKSLEMTATGNPLHTYSARSDAVINAPVPTPVELYQRVFGYGFQDPNASEFRPDPHVLARNSVLSAVQDERAEFLKGLGATDRTRLDEYFTSVRQLEQQLLIQLEKPEKLVACQQVSKPEETPVGAEIDTVSRNHELMSSLLAMALACNQTKVFNLVFADFTSTLRQRGSATSHHSITHEESTDPKLGYQVKVSWFTEQCMNQFAHFLRVLDSIPEGDGTLLDNTIVFAHSDVSYARVHALDGIPILLAGSGGGRLRTGHHVVGQGQPASRIGLTVQQAMKVSVERWGAGSMQTSKPVSEVML